eukprot:1938242-Pleurochrysis_carterae.AAC.3
MRARRFICSPAPDPSFEFQNACDLYSSHLSSIAILELERKAACDPVEVCSSRSSTLYRAVAAAACADPVVLTTLLDLRTAITQGLASSGGEQAAWGTADAHASAMLVKADRTGTAASNGGQTSSLSDTFKIAELPQDDDGMFSGLLSAHSSESRPADSAASIEALRPSSNQWPDTSQREFGGAYDEMQSGNPAPLSKASGSEKFPTASTASSSAADAMTPTNAVPASRLDELSSLSSLANSLLNELVPTPPSMDAEQRAQFEQVRREALPKFLARPDLKLLTPEQQAAWLNARHKEIRQRLVAFLEPQQVKAWTQMLGGG